MKNPAQALALILSAALLLPGCATGPVSVAPVEEGRKSGALKRSVVVPKLGSVSVSFPGLAPRPRTYRTLATQADIESVSIYLRDSRTAHSQHLDRQALERPRVDLAFRSVATGPITMRVEAYDNAGTLIGEAEQEARLGSGESLVLNLTVALIDSGDVGAVIRFVDGAPSSPPPHPCLGMFRNGDGDQDGKLTYSEWLSGNMVPPVPNRYEIFQNHDADRDGYLSPQESCGAVADMPRVAIPYFPPVPTPVMPPPAFR